MEIKYMTNGKKLTLECDDVSVHGCVAIADAMIRKARTFMDRMDTHATRPEPDNFDFIEGTLEDVQNLIGSLDIFIEKEVGEFEFYFREQT